MSRITILNAEEIKVFDKPPRFTEEQQHKYFTLTPQLLSLIEKLRTATNQVCTTVHWGYFRATGRFLALLQKNILKKHLYFFIYLMRPNRTMK
jgi:hypothetical protein